MIKQETTIRNNETYFYTYSTENYYITREDGKLFANCFDKTKKNYIETNIKITSPKPELESLYPVGAIYIGITEECPLQTLGIGTWELVSSGKVLQGAQNSSETGTEKAAGLPQLQLVMRTDSTSSTTTELLNQYGNDGYTATTPSNTSGTDECMTTNYTTHNAKNAYMDLYDNTGIYGKSNTVQPPAYLVNIWQRIS